MAPISVRRRSDITWSSQVSCFSPQQLTVKSKRSDVVSVDAQEDVWQGPVNRVPTKMTKMSCKLSEGKGKMAPFITAHVEETKTLLHIAGVLASE